MVEARRREGGNVALGAPTFGDQESVTPLEMLRNSGARLASGS